LYRSSNAEQYNEKKNEFEENGQKASEGGTYAGGARQEMGRQ